MSGGVLYSWVVTSPVRLEASVGEWVGWDFPFRGREVVWILFDLCTWEM